MITPAAPIPVELSKDLAHHLRQGHPWVFKKALLRPPRLEPGAVVDVVSGGKFVARGLYDPISPIAVRVFTLRADEPLDGELFARRAETAAALRREVIDASRTDSFRLIHGENDFLPGVVCDIYAGYAVLKLYSASLTPHRQALVDAVRRAWPELLGVFGRDEVGREDEDDAHGGAKGRVLFGQPPPERISIREEGMQLYVDVRLGQKTGLFLDQRENRLALRRYVRGRDVLNCFAFTGGFSVSAALGGARKVLSLDLDGDAIALARDNFTLNGLDASVHDFMVGDVFKWLAQWKQGGRSFDAIVLDPPAFAKSQAKVQAALSGYAALNRAALQLLRPGGILVTASCSARVTPEAFQGCIAEAAGKVDASLQLLEERGQPPDHPVSIRFPQGRYLKLLIYRKLS